VVGSVPTALIGLAFEDVFERLFATPIAVGVALLVTGCVLFATRFAPLGTADQRSMTWGRALAVGFVQGLAITPGISRSGSTIAAALFLGLKRDFAARFSFLLSVPAIGGAFLLKARHLEVAGANALPLLVGFSTAALSGYVALRVLLRLVNNGDFSRFAWYLWPVGLLALGLGIFAP
jgi:undecaprenyl-diphosphatase